MNKLQLKGLIAIAALATIFSSCRKDRVTPDPVDSVAPANGIYILNEGNFSRNNSSLTFFSISSQTTISDIFKTQNGRGLGDTGNDAKVYGSKMYIAVNVSSTIEVVDAKTAKVIKQIKLSNGGVDRQPRSIVFNKNKAFISSYDGTVAVLDTASLTVDKYITVGRNPEEMVISNGKLYVANSGGLDYANPDKTVSVIDLNTLTETKKIDITTTNPINIAADAYGDVYVLAYGTDYPSKPKLVIIDNKTDAVKASNDINAGYGTSFIVVGDDAYYITDSGKISVYSVKTESLRKENFITDGTTFKAPYALAVDAATGQVYVTDAIDYSSNGRLYTFNSTGKNQDVNNKGYVTDTGINPGTIVLLTK
ncbi:DUF5074 domain-containing protein [Mucilaginibacter sp. 44-25]|uniref:DUF5074 domain-containing protein n=1 Tax=Mucilaginibacter sp. 44-25 TaxID=1895794 RepID=UPI00095F4B35|nr:DUF5074 domain-containing protein [Mucilaginibacter sp. 44-25]OJW18474.1 MAG: hypothetical protein BGO48_18235 [Mucilaginibacter sp. 44-25]